MYSKDSHSKPEDEAKLKVVLKKFEEYCAPRKKTHNGCFLFNERRQGDSESFDSFVTDLKILVEDCGYQEEERMVRDAIVFRCKHPKVGEKCLDQADALTCEKAIEIGPNLRNKPQQSEEARQRRRPNREYPESEKRPPWNRRQRSNKSKGKTEKTAEAKDVESKHNCGRCGYDKAHKKCPAMGQQCRHCKMQKDESFLETLFVKGSPSVTRGSRFRPGNRRRL